MILFGAPALLLGLNALTANNESAPEVESVLDSGETYDE